MARSTTTDPQIREAFHRKRLRRHHDNPQTLVIDELSLLHGRNRIDVVVFNGRLHGYEIKSGRDSLDRLPNQISTYMSCLELITVVADEHHIAKIEKLVPDFCGIISVQQNRGDLTFTTFRETRQNTELQIGALAQLLWKNEALSLLTDRGLKPRELARMNRKELYKLISVTTPLHVLRGFLKSRFRNRPNWITDAQPRSYVY